MKEKVIIIGQQVQRQEIRFQQICGWREENQMKSQKIFR